MAAKRGLRALRACRSGPTRTTSHTRPTFSSPRITSAEMSIWYQRSPWAAEVGKAWWLLCQDSPNDGSASHDTLRESFGVAKLRRPKKWQSELML